MNDYSFLPVVFQQFPYFGFGESDHVVEYRVGALIAGDIEATCEIVHRYRADTGDVHTFHNPVSIVFDGFEKVPQKTVAMGEGAITGIAVDDQYVVGKVIVLVEDEVHLQALSPQ